jgi:hypothetical protein
LFCNSETKEKKEYFEMKRIRERRENSIFWNSGVKNTDE